MKRRDFLAMAGCALAAHVKALGVSPETSPAPPRDLTKIEYIRPEIPVVAIPAYDGARYTDRVPDTFDPAECARLTLNALTGPLDPKLDYRLFMMLRIFSDPPAMEHSFNDWCQPMFMQSLQLSRLMLGDPLRDQVDRVWMDVVLKSIGPDGLFYFPTQGNPWFYEFTLREACVGRKVQDVHVDMGKFVPTILLPGGAGPTSDTKSYSQFAHPFPNERILGLITLYSLRDDNPIWKQTAERMIDRWAELAIDKGDYAYFPYAVFAPGAKEPANLKMPLGHWSVLCSGRLIQALAQYYRAWGYEPAKKLAEKLTRYQRYEAQQFDPKDGRFLALSEPGGDSAMEIGGPQRYGGHFSGHATGLVSLIDFAIAVQDRELMEYVRSSYEWARDYETCIPLVGYFPTQLRRDIATMVRTTSAGPVETCEVTDMMAVAIKLSQAGVGDYWDDVDRWLRNQLAENQLTSSEWAYRMAQTQDALDVLPNESADHPIERNVGGFAGWAAINDWVVRHKPHRFGIMHCCTANAARVLYYAWEGMLAKDGGTLRLNLLMNRASAWADVYSYIPYTGQVEIKLKQACQAAELRVPEWIASGSRELTCTVQGKPVKTTWAGRYVRLGPLRAGDRVVMQFPITERTEKVRTMGVEYTVVVKGSTVVAIDPGGVIQPFYQRAHMRKTMAAEQAPHRTVERYVPKKTIAL